MPLSLWVSNVNKPSCDDLLQRLVVPQDGGHSLGRQSLMTQKQLDWERQLFLLSGWTASVCFIVLSWRHSLTIDFSGKMRNSSGSLQLWDWRLCLESITQHDVLSAYNVHKYKALLSLRNSVSLTMCLKAHIISPSTLPRTHCVDQAVPDFTEVFLLLAPQWLGLREHTTAQTEFYTLRYHLAMVLQASLKLVIHCLSLSFLR